MPKGFEPVTDTKASWLCSASGPPGVRPGRQDCAQGKAAARTRPRSELVEKAKTCAPCVTGGEGEGGGEGGLSTATVFLPGGDPCNGVHVVDPDCAEDKCFGAR